jgi:hypothetical protein
MRATDLTRRTFIQRIAVASAATVGTTYLAGCGGGESDAGGESGGGETAALSCDDVSALSETDLATRNALEYVEVSIEEGKDCTNCQQYQAPDGDGCGTCLVVPGTINPVGYCSSWTELVS